MAASRPTLAASAARSRDVDRRLKAEFPDYTTLSRPEPLSVAEQQAELRADG
jgi:hypothetical protein